MDPKKRGGLKILPGKTGISMELKIYIQPPGALLVAANQAKTVTGLFKRWLTNRIKINTQICKVFLGMDRLRKRSDCFTAAGIGLRKRLDCITTAGIGLRKRLDCNTAVGIGLRTRLECNT